VNIRRSIAVTTLAVILTASACGSSPSRSSSASSSASTPTSGCGHAATGSSTLHLEVDGRRRVVIVHVPTGYTGNTRVALVLNLHGSGSTAAAQELFSGMDSTSDQDGFVVAYPQALIASGTGFDWNIPNEPLVGGTYPAKSAADDVIFLTHLVPQLAGRYCIDSSRVYATGVSGGGRMASQLACDAAGTFAAVAPVAGLRFPDPCPATRAVPIVAFHGTADPVDPYNGNGLAYWTYSVPVAAQRWATHDACGSTPQTTSGSGYTLTDYSGCASGATVELYALTGEGHEWPGGPTMPRRITKPLGPQSDAVDANSVMWAFFLAHPAP
jgi:polyhydroxybutyrate depolymerase